MSVYCKSYNQSFSKKSKFISLSLKLSVSLQKYQSLSKLSLSVSLQNYHYQSLSKIIIINLSPKLSLSVSLDNHHYQSLSKIIIISLSPKLSLSVSLQNYQSFSKIINVLSLFQIIRLWLKFFSSYQSGQFYSTDITIPSYIQKDIIMIQLTHKPPVYSVFIAMTN